MTAMTEATQASAPNPMAAVGDEGLRLFFPLAAVQAALWPFIWVVVDRLDMPLATDLPPGLWHANEMIFGAFGAALIGFITTAVPEWTDTPRLRGKPLFALAAVWSAARIVGFLGADAMQLVAAIADTAWLLALLLYAGSVSWRKRSANLLGFLVWLAALLALCAATRGAFLADEVLAAQEALWLAGLAFLGLLGVALARITVPVTNLVLDPSERTSPFRPHPGRRNLASGLIAVLIVGEIAGLSDTVLAYLFIAAGAAFLDRTGESFIGRQTFRTEILCLSGSSLMAGAGLLLVGASRLGAPFPDVPALHLALMGGLGLGVLTVFSIAGLLHTGRPLGIPFGGRVALVLLVVAVGTRVLPDLGVVPQLPGPPYAIASTIWAASFLLWLKTYWPYLSDLRSPGEHKC